ncbi:hypothetical protein BpHYR1_039132, partial [Brachionus plicatilis]
SIEELKSSFSWLKEFRLFHCLTLYGYTYLPKFKKIFFKFKILKIRKPVKALEMVKMLTENEDYIGFCLELDLL